MKYSMSMSFHLVGSIFFFFLSILMETRNTKIYPTSQNQQQNLSQQPSKKSILSPSQSQVPNQGQEHSRERQRNHSQKSQGNQSQASQGQSQGQRENQSKSSPLRQGQRESQGHKNADIQIQLENRILNNSNAIGKDGQPKNQNQNQNQNQKSQGQGHDHNESEKGPNLENQQNKNKIQTHGRPVFLNPKKELQKHPQAWKEINKYQYVNPSFNDDEIPIAPASENQLTLLSGIRSIKSVSVQLSKEEKINRRRKLLALPSKNYPHSVGSPENADIGLINSQQNSQYLSNLSRSLFLSLSSYPPYSDTDVLTLTNGGASTTSASSSSIPGFDRLEDSDRLFTVTIKNNKDKYKDPEIKQFPSIELSPMLTWGNKYFKVLNHLGKHIYSVGEVRSPCYNKCTKWQFFMYVFTTEGIPLYTIAQRNSSYCHCHCQCDLHCHCSNSCCHCCNNSKGQSQGDYDHLDDDWMTYRDADNFLNQRFSSSTAGAITSSMQDQVDDLGLELDTHDRGQCHVHVSLISGAFLGHIWVGLDNFIIHDIEYNPVLSVEDWNRHRHLLDRRKKVEKPSGDEEKEVQVKQKCRQDEKVNSNVNVNSNVGVKNSTNFGVPNPNVVSMSELNFSQISQLPSMNMTRSRSDELPSLTMLEPQQEVQGQGQSQTRSKQIGSKVSQNQFKRISKQSKQSKGNEKEKTLEQIGTVENEASANEKSAPNLKIAMSHSESEKEKVSDSHSSPLPVEHEIDGAIRYALFLEAAKVGEVRLNVDLAEFGIDMKPQECFSVQFPMTFEQEDKALILAVLLCQQRSQSESCGQSFCGLFLTPYSIIFVIVVSLVVGLVITLVALWKLNYFDFT